MPTTGWIPFVSYTSVDRDSKTGWYYPERAAAEDGSKAYLQITAGSYSDWLRCVQLTEGYLPSNGVTAITGIEVAIKREADYDDRLYDSAIYLRDASGQVGDNKASANPFKNAIGWEYYGGASDMWGTSLTISDILASTFGIDISIGNTSGSNDYANIDVVLIRFTYTTDGLHYIDNVASHVLHGINGVGNVASHVLHGINGVGNVAAHVLHDAEWVTPFNEGTNVFENTPECVALYKFIPYRFAGHDFIGTNELEQYGSGGYVDVTNDLPIGSFNHFVGNNGAWWDDSLPADFPLQAADTVKRMSATMWYRPTAVPTYVTGIFNITNSYYDTSTVILHGGDATRYMSVRWGNGAGYEDHSFSWKPTQDQWYHVGFVVDGIAKTCRVRVYGLTEDAIVCDETHTFTHELYVAASWLNIGQTILGGTGVFIGDMAEVAVFNVCLVTADIDNIRAGTFTDIYRAVPMRQFPVFPIHRVLQSQTNKRVFPVIN